eukprot:4334507-Pleurochrysis_carterae.AAC.1
MEITALRLLTDKSNEVPPSQDMMNRFRTLHAVHNQLQPAQIKQKTMFFERIAERCFDSSSMCSTTKYQPICKAEKQQTFISLSVCTGWCAAIVLEQWLRLGLAIASEFLRQMNI